MVQITSNKTERVVYVMKTEKKVCISGHCLSTGTCFLKHAPFLLVCRLRGVLWHYRKSGSTSLGKKDKRECVCSAEGKGICTQLSLIANTHEQKHNRAQSSQPCTVSMLPTCWSVRVRVSPCFTFPHLTTTCCSAC